MSRGRVLIVSYYFPPAGGSGVHRVLKLCKYLPEFGWDVEVLAPDDPTSSRMCRTAWWCTGRGTSARISP